MLLENLKNKVEETRKNRIVINQILKEKGTSRECKDALRSEKDEIIMTLTKKVEEMDVAEIFMKLKRKI